MSDGQKRQFALPPSLAEPADISRANREIDEVDDVLREAEIRSPGTATTLPRMSKGLLDMAEMNGLNLLQQNDRDVSKRLLAALDETAPVMHISFAAEPSPSFIYTIITELRRRIHPLVLVQVGLQPSLAGGCMVRTENKMFDFSLRQHLTKNKSLLAKILAEKDKTESQIFKPIQSTPVNPALIASDTEAHEIQPAQEAPAPAPETTS